MYERYPPELIDEVVNNNDIVAVVSDYVKLEKKGKDYFALCPFHREKTASFSVVPAKQIFYCFGCGKGGNVLHFIMEAENLDFIESVKLLAEKANIDLPEGEEGEEKDKARKRKILLQICKDAARYFYSKLNSREGAEAREYLKNRGIIDKTIIRFGMGWSQKAWDGLYRHLTEKGYDKEHILASGLVLTSSKGSYYDRFRGRIMFPIFDVRGNVIGFGGRTMNSSEGPKYVNSPETMIYNKGRNLYALNFAKNADLKNIIVVEGYMDVITLQQSGIKNTVASLGTALTEAQGRLLKRYADEVIISFDADASGQAATIRGLDLLDGMGCSVKVLTIPESKDPDEYIRKNGVEKFKKLISSALSLPEYKILKLEKGIEISDTDSKIEFLNKAAKVLGKIDNNIEREVYIKKIADDYNISEQSLAMEVAKSMKKLTNKGASGLGKYTGKDSGKSDETNANRVLDDERMLIVLLCINNSIYYKIADRIRIEIFSDENNREIARILLEKLGNNIEIGTGELMNIIKQEDIGHFARIIKQDCHFEDISKAVEEKIESLEIYGIQKRQKEILELLSKKEELPKGDVERLKNELIKVTSLIRNKK